MKKWVKIILILGLAGVITGGIITYKILTKPHRDVTTEKAIAVKA